MVRSFSRRARNYGTRLIYRVAGLPIAVRALRHPPPHNPGKLVRSAYRTFYWAPHSPGELLELVLGLILSPLAVLAMMLWFTARNGGPIKARTGRSVPAQLADQIWLYVKAGVLPPWYYVYELHRHPVKRAARSFIQRCECKSGVPALLKDIRPPASELTDKVEFARWCEEKKIPTVPVLAVVHEDGVVGIRSLDQLQRDLFVKPVDGKGGRGTERWDYLGEGRHRSGDGRELDTSAMLISIAAASWAGPRIIQPRIRNHPDLLPLNNDALATVRALTCLDETGHPELWARSCGWRSDRTTSSTISMPAGLPPPSTWPRAGWAWPATSAWIAASGGSIGIPNSGALIAGFRLPDWDEFRSFAESAHRAFSDRIMVGWDIAITPDGLLVVEGNGSPDLDIMQRAYRRGWMTDRLGQLLSHHVVEFGCVELAKAA